MKLSNLVKAALLGGTAVLTAGTAAAEDRVYYYASQLLGHPYLLDNHLGMRYAAEQFGVEIRTTGPQGWDPAGAAEAVEQAIAKEPDGIITSLWEPGAVPAIKRAMEQGIPVIVIEATVENHGAMTFIGLDNYQSGVEQAKELIRLAGTEGTYVASGNWGASNTDAKITGFTDYITANSNWTEAGRVDDKANTADAIEAGKAIFNTFGDIDGIVGFDASSGTGICLAAEELGLDISEMAVVVNDREAPVLECIADGVIDSSIINKTALESFMAIQILEAYNDATVGLANVPISADNMASNIVSAPEVIYMGAAVINADNIESFMHENISQYE